MKTVKFGKPLSDMHMMFFRIFFNFAEKGAGKATLFFYERMKLHTLRDTTQPEFH
jgi:hypothetical protein